MVKISSIEISVIKHSTEDEAKIEKCLSSLIPPEEREKMKIVKSSAKGHYGNEIVYMKIVETANSEKIAMYVLNRLDDYSKGILLQTVEQRTEDKKLYLRLHKHMLLENKFIISDSDEAVRVLIRFASKEALAQAIEEALKGR